jgi:FkbH-like protein
VLRAAGAFLPGAALARLAERLPADPRRTEIETAVTEALERAPGEVALIRAGATLAIRRGDGPGAHQLLDRLGAADGSQGTMTWIRKQRKSLPAEGGRPVRIALLSSYTIDPLVPYLDLEVRRLGLEPEIYVAPFNTWMRETLDPASGLRRFAPDLAFLSVGLDDLVPELAGAPDAETLAHAGAEALARVLEAATRYAEWAHKPLVVHGFHSAFTGPLGVLEGRGGLSRGQWIAELTARLGAGLRDLPQCYLLDVAGLLAQHRGGPDNPKLRLLASMRLPPEALSEAARAYARYVAPQMGLTRKCVVLDLDNTLWGGVVGEDGPQGIRLGLTAPGSEYVEFQRFLATLPQRGILLAIASKNNPDDALEVIRGHEAMVLREGAFSALRINWRPKPENLASIAEELNIGVDSLVYVDDNPDEREQMRQLLPQVLTVDLPRDPALYRSTLERLPELQVLGITEEDRLRAGQYVAKREREQIRVQAASVDDYLRSLGIKVAIDPLTEPDVSRVAQLFQRTNQFNVTTRRYDAGAVLRILGDSAWRSWTLRASDRFGDHGLVATALARANGTEWTLDSFLMSCRVIGYGIETALLADIIAAATAAGATRLRGEFIPTKKNVPARDLFARHGFQLADKRSDGGELWTYDFAAGPLAFPHWIERIT